MHHIDFHVHIDFYQNPTEIANLYESLKIYTIFVTNLPELYRKHIINFNNYKYVRLAIGYHPQISDEYPFEKDIFKEEIKKCRYIGEVGLDFHSETKESISNQIKSLEFITQPEFNLGRIYSLHSKKAEDEVLDILSNNNVKHAVFHWYSGKISTLKKIINHGYYFSVNYKMLTTKSGTEILKKIPLERLLFETDGPFIRYKKKITKPYDIADIYQEFEDLIPNFPEIVFNNFKRLLIEKDLDYKMSVDKKR